MRTKRWKKDSLRLLVSVFDVSDAFLMVSQKSYVVVQVPKWVQEILKNPTLHFWKVKKCLPGQRSAALEWHQFFSGLCTEFDFEPYQCGTLFRHRKKNSYLSVHINDILLIGPGGMHEAFLHHFSKLLKSRKLAKLAGVTLAIARFLSTGCKS